MKRSLFAMALWMMVWSVACSEPAPVLADLSDNRSAAVDSPAETKGKP